MTLKSSHSQTRFGKRTTWSGNCGFDDNGDDDADADDGFCNLNPKNISNLWSLITSMSVHQLSYHLIMMMMMMMMVMSYPQPSSIQLAPIGDGYDDFDEAKLFLQPWHDIKEIPTTGKQDQPLCLTDSKSNKRTLWQLHRAPKAPEVPL